jgi:DNA-binding transcriptional ArsR family regulator
LCASRQAIRAVRGRGKVTSALASGPELVDRQHWAAAISMPWLSARCGRKYGRHDVGLRQRPSSPYTEPIGALSLTLDATFFALSDPKRRGILERLGRGPATLSQLAGPSGLTLNGIKKHVGILELAGLVETEKVGRVRECRLGPATTLGEAGEWIEAHRRAWEGRLDRFERFVERAT